MVSAYTGPWRVEGGGEQLSNRGNAKAPLRFQRVKSLSTALINENHYTASQTGLGRPRVGLNQSRWWAAVRTRAKTLRINTFVHMQETQRLDVPASDLIFIWSPFVMKGRGRVHNTQVLCSISLSLFGLRRHLVTTIFSPKWLNRIKRRKHVNDKYAIFEVN